MPWGRPADQFTAFRGWGAPNPWEDGFGGSSFGAPAGVTPATVPGASQTSPVPGSSAFNLTPSPQAGIGAYGAVPGQLGLPDPYADLSRAVPGLPNLNQAGSSALLAKLQGQISPATQMALQDAAARFGVQSGMPGSGLSGNRSLRDLGRLSEDQQAAGLAVYGPFVGAVSATQTVRPELQNEIALQNAVNAAAPNPTQAASEAERLFNNYLNKLGQSQRGPAGGTGGGSGVRSPASGTGFGTGLVPPVVPGGGGGWGVLTPSAPTGGGFQPIDLFGGSTPTAPGSLNFAGGLGTGFQYGTGAPDLGVGFGGSGWDDQYGWTGDALPQWDTTAPPAPVSDVGYEFDDFYEDFF